MTLIGPAGSGKTRLARELMSSWQGKRSDGKIVNVTASQFAADLAEASSTDAIRQFQIRYRKEVILFVCEDLQSLAGRTESQQQLTTAIDDVTSQGGCVLLTSTVMPSGIPRCNRRLANRIRGGLCVEMSLPQSSSRKKLLNHFLQTESVQLSTDEIERITNSIEFSARDLIGLIEQIKSFHRLNRGEKELRQYLDQLAESPACGLKEIATAVAREFDTTIPDLRGPSRSQTIRTARHVAMHLARQRTDATLKEIGDYFGRGNHSTVIHACKKISEHLSNDDSLAFQVENIVKELRKKV